MVLFVVKVEVKKEGTVEKKPNFLVHFLEFSQTHFHFPLNLSFSIKSLQFLMQSYMLY